MALYAIGDLHFSGAKHKPMDIFGDNWFMHQEKIIKNWKSTITENDFVLIPGDISWAMNLEEAKIDLDIISALPGKKIMIKGNHDYWWGSVSKLNSMYENIHFLQNDYYVCENFAICGSRGWLLPESDNFTKEDLKIYKRELLRARNSLEGAKLKGFERIIFMIHYPPVLNGKEESEFIDIFKEFNVERVIYGHLHGNLPDYSKEKVIENIQFNLVSSDQIDFYPVKISE